jgi:glutaredoxin-like YruB-family protein
MKIIIYTTPVCPFCVLVKNFLKQNNIKYEEVDVSKDRNKAEYLFKKTGAMNVPVTEIDDKIVIGYDTKKLKEILRL